MAVEKPTNEKQVPTVRPVITTYLSTEFYKAALQWLAENDERSMAWLVAKWVEGKIDEAIAEGEIPSDVVQRLKVDTGEGDRT
ncbi:MAG: hypothetical protein F6K19_44680 [Cyanothece sp. SIO1E1]|nr:hypothetical protein [Cyanothece sp. SIO1E1]